METKKKQNENKLRTIEEVYKFVKKRISSSEKGFEVQCSSRLRFQIFLLSVNGDIKKGKKHILRQFKVSGKSKVWCHILSNNSKCAYRYFDFLDTLDNKL